jgi:hypothetical protein
MVKKPFWRLTAASGRYLMRWRDQVLTPAPTGHDTPVPPSPQ